MNIEDIVAAGINVINTLRGSWNPNALIPGVAKAKADMQKFIADLNDHDRGETGAEWVILDDACNHARIICELLALFEADNDKEYLIPLAIFQADQMRKVA